MRHVNWEAWLQLKIIWCFALVSAPLLPNPSYAPQYLPLIYSFQVKWYVFVNSLHHPIKHFNIKIYITFSDLDTRSSASLKLKQAFTKSIYATHPDISFSPSFPVCGTHSHLSTSILHLSNPVNPIQFLWFHFDSHCDPTNHCTHHYIPCDHAQNAHSLIPSNPFHNLNNYISPFTPYRSQQFLLLRL